MPDDTKMEPARSITMFIGRRRETCETGFAIHFTAWLNYTDQALPDYSAASVAAASERIECVF